MFLFFSNHQGTTHFGTFFGDGLETPQHPEVSGKLDSYPLKGSKWGFLTMCQSPEKQMLVIIVAFSNMLYFGAFPIFRHIPTRILDKYVVGYIPIYK